jgi:hypothetical protein
MQVRAGDTVMISNAKLGWSSKVFEVMEWNFASDGNPPQIYVDMTLRETASSVYSWTVSDEIAVADSPNTTLPNPFTLSAPTNLTLTADGTTQQIQADGTALPRIQVSWTAPTEGFIQSGGTVGIEYKESTSTSYLTWGTVPGDQTTDFISSDVKIGLTYNVRIYGESYFGVSTSYVTATVNVQKDPAAPDAPAWGVFTTDAPAAKTAAGTGYLLGIRASWADVTDPALGYYEIKSTTTDNDAATDFNWSTSRAAFPNTPTSDRLLETSRSFYSESPAPNGYVRVRSVNRSGVASSWLKIGDALAVAVVGAGTIAPQSSADVTTTGIKTGGGASTLQVNVVYETNEVVNITAGGTSTTVPIAISGKGFSAKPDDGIVVVEDVLYAGFYDSQDAGSSSTTAVVKIFRNDGGTLASGGLRLSARFTDYT